MPAAPTPEDSPALRRLGEAVEWAVVLGLGAMLAWTTLCLGGYLAETMVWSSRALWGLVLLAVLACALRPRALDWRVLLPVPFLLFAAASVLWLAPAPWLAWREWLLWFQMWLVLVLAWHFGRSRAQTWTLLGLLLALTLTGAAMAAYQRFVDPSWIMLGLKQASQFTGRSAGMFGIPNSLATLLELALPLLAVTLARRHLAPAWRIAVAWLLAVQVFALVLTGSRGGWIATVAALALWPLLNRRSWRQAWLGFAGVLAAVAIGLVAVYHASEHARARIDPFLAGEFESSRPIIWKVGLVLWQQAPWLGTGAASYNVLFDQHRPKGFLNEPDWTHNDYLNTLSDYGLVGFSLWFGAGAWLLAEGWREVRRRRREAATAAGFLASWRFRFGLWLGCVAYAVHLVVDFHTKIPALAFWGAVVLAWVLRRDDYAPGWKPSRTGVALAALPIAALLLVVAWRADRLYRSEALRFEPRREIDRVALGRATLDRVVPPALLAFQRAVKIDPANGEAWGDLAYAITLSWHVTQGNVGAIGRRAEVAARRALALCPVVAEYWVQLGVALDMQGRQPEAEEAFRRALALAPRNPEWHYHYAHHLAAREGRRDEARAAVATCLDLDPSNPQAKSLLTRLTDVR